MTVQDMVEYAVAKVSLGNPGRIDRDVWDFAMMALNRNAEMIWNSHDWLNSKIVNLRVTTSQAIITFPAYIDFVKAARIGGTPVEAKDPVLMNFQRPLDFDEVGDVAGFVALPHTAVTRQPLGAATLTVLSDNVEDSGTVRLSGVTDRGGLQHEELSIKGTTPILTRHKYVEVRGLSKTGTKGAIRLLDGEEAIAEMGARDTASAYRRVALSPSPVGEVTVTFQAKRRFVRMESNFDVFPVYEAEGALVDALVAELYEYSGKPELAGQAKRQSEEKLLVLVSAERNQAAMESRVVPRYPMFDEVGVY